MGRHTGLEEELHTAVVEKERHIGLVAARRPGKPGIRPAGLARLDQYAFNIYNLS